MIDARRQRERRVSCNAQNGEHNRQQKKTSSEKLQCRDSVKKKARSICKRGIEEEIVINSWLDRSENRRAAEKSAARSRFL